MRTFSLSLIEDGVDAGSMTLERDFCHRRRVVDVGPQADAPPSISAFMRAKFSACACLPSLSIFFPKKRPISLKTCLKRLGLVWASSAVFVVI